MFVKKLLSSHAKKIAMLIETKNGAILKNTFTIFIEYILFKQKCKTKIFRMLTKT